MGGGWTPNKNADITVLSLFVMMFAGILFYDEISEALSPVIHDVICGDVALTSSSNKMRRMRR
jgi:hypothetical protein